MRANSTLPVSERRGQRAAQRRRSASAIGIGSPVDAVRLCARSLARRLQCAAVPKTTHRVVTRAAAQSEHQGNAACAGVGCCVSACPMWCRRSIRATFLRVRARCATHCADLTNSHTGSRRLDTAARRCRRVQARIATAAETSINRRQFEES